MRRLAVPPEDRTTWVRKAPWSRRTRHRQVGGDPPSHPPATRCDSCRSSARSLRRVAVLRTESRISAAIGRDESLWHRPPRQPESTEVAPWVRAQRAEPSRPPHPPRVLAREPRCVVPGDHHAPIAPAGATVIPVRLAVVPRRVRARAPLRTGVHDVQACVGAPTQHPLNVAHHPRLLVPRCAA
jgi:hypothetical protein